MWRVASRKGVPGDWESEVSGTAKGGTDEQEVHKEAPSVVEVAQHTEGWDCHN